MSAVYTLTFRDEARKPCLCQAEERLDLVVEVLQRLGVTEPNPVLVLPAGFVWTRSTRERDKWVEALGRVSKDSRTGLVIGIDLETGDKGNLDSRASSLAYVYDCGRLQLTAIARESSLGARTVTIGALRSTLLFGQELFRPAALAAVGKTRPDLAIVLGHAGPTKRWIEPLAVLDVAAPTLLVHSALEVRRPIKATPPRGWRSMVTPNGLVKVTRWTRQPDGATDSVVGH